MRISLQWGHVQMNVEILVRKLVRPSISSLQWGHVQMNVEMTSRADYSNQSVVASMGPRSNERGNLQALPCRDFYILLQWGHVQMNVEI